MTTLLNPQLDNKTQMARDWYAISEQLTALKEQERELREAVITAYLGAEPQAGTHRQVIKDGVDLVVTIPKKVELDKGFFEEHKAELLHRGLVGDDRLIRVKYEVSATALKHLSDSDKNKFSEMFIHKTGSPQMKIEIKKG